ncbi:hypothetical protein PENTCL1PPCAC_8557, partial [Pristionchus entomophagus]
MSAGARKLEEENKSLRETVARLTEEKRKSEEENTKLREKLANQTNSPPGLSSLQLPSINGQSADYTSK